MIVCNIVGSNVGNEDRSIGQSELTTAVIRVPDPFGLTEASASLLASSLIGSVASFVHLSTLPLRP